jgi:hypothetical protein
MNSVRELRLERTTVRVRDVARLQFTFDRSIYANFTACKDPHHLDGARSELASTKG